MTGLMEIVKSVNSNVPCVMERTQIVLHAWVIEQEHRRVTAQKELLMMDQAYYAQDVHFNARLVQKQEINV